MSAARRPRSPAAPPWSATRPAWASATSRAPGPAPRPTPRTRGPWPATRPGREAAGCATSRTTSVQRGQREIEKPVPVEVHRLAGPDQQGIGERGAVVHERVVLPALAGGVETVGDADLGEQVGIQLAAQEAGGGLVQVHADHDHAIAPLDHFVDQLDSGLAPEQLDVLQLSGAHPPFVPTAHVLEMDVAEHDALASAHLEVVQ